MHPTRDHGAAAAACRAPPGWPRPAPATSALWPELARRLRPLPGLGVGELDRIEQATRAASVLHPLQRRRFELAAVLLLGTVGLDPTCQGRPGGDHNLVREVDARLAAIIAFVRGEQASVDQPPENEVEVGGIVIGGP